MAIAALIIGIIALASAITALVLASIALGRRR